MSNNGNRGGKAAGGAGGKGAGTGGKSGADAARKGKAADLGFKPASVTRVG